MLHFSLFLLLFVCNKLPYLLLMALGLNEDKLY